MTKHVNSQTVVYSFGGRWEEPLLNKEISVFFRKRRPVVLPDKVFFYIGSPVKKIVGFSKVISIEPISFAGAKQYMKAGKISENELIDYIGKNGHVHAIHIQDIEIFKNPIDLDSLRDEFDFNPPQSFSKVSANFERWLVENGQ